MQAVFFLSLFSLVFLMFSSLTAGMSKNIMQENIEKIEETKNIFASIETALNVLAYKQKDSAGRAIIDLSDSDLTNLSGTFLAEHIGYTKKQIANDPWEKAVKLFKFHEQEAIWGGKGGQLAKAPITTIMLVSAGPNNQYDILNHLGLPQNQTVLTENQIKQTDITDPAVVADDIIVRFNNYDAMLDIWEKSENLDNTIKNISYDYYRGKLDAFTPLIQLSERDHAIGGALKDDIFSDLDKTKGYIGFDSLINDDQAFSTYWNDPVNPLNAILQNYRANPKTYAGEFRLAEVGAAGDAEHNELEDAFEAEYGASRKYHYPSFDTLLGATDGLENLGISNLSSLDPFDGNTGLQVGYDYSPIVPEKFKIIRKSTSTDKKKWNVKKELEIDGLGGI